MPIGISDFRAIATGTHNMGDVRLSQDGNKLEKVNNFVHRTSKNVTVLSVKENLAVRQAFFKALTSDGRMTPELHEAFERELLGDNAAKTLTRNEITAFLKALDAGTAVGLSERVVSLHGRSVEGGKIAGVKSEKTVAYMKSINEEKDEVRGACQTARREIEILRALVKYVQMTLNSAEVHVDRMAEALVNVLKGLSGADFDADSVRQQLTDGFYAALNGRTHDTAVLNQALQGVVDHVLDAIPDANPLKAEIRMVLSGTDESYFAPSVLKAMHALGVDEPKVDLSNMVRPFNLDMTFGVDGEFKRAVEFQLSNPAHKGTGPQATEMARNQLLADVTRGNGLTVNGQRKDFSSVEARNQSMTDIENFFAQDAAHGEAARNMVFQIASQQGMANIMNGMKSSPFPNSFGLRGNATETSVTRNGDGTYSVQTTVSSKIIAVRGVVNGEDTAIPVETDSIPDTNFSARVNIRVSFDANGAAVCTVEDGSEINVRTPPRDGNYIVDGITIPTSDEEFEAAAANLPHASARLKAMTPDDLARVIMDEVVDPQPFDHQGRSDLIALSRDYAKVISVRIEMALKAGHADEAQTLRNTEKVVQRRIDQLRKMEDLSPLSYKNVLSSVRGWNTAADVLYRAICHETGVDVDPIMLGELFMDMPAFDGVKDMNAECKDAKKCLDGLSDKVADRLMNVIKAKGLANPMKRAYNASKIDKKFVKNLLVEQWGDCLNHGKWDKIAKNLSFTATVGGAKQNFTAQSMIVPSKQINGFSTNHRYENGENGFMCHSFGAKHAVNLAQSTFSVGGKQVFSGIRHGVNAAIDIKDEAERIRANIQRAKETVTAAVLANSSVMDQINALPPGSTGPVKVTIMSTSLLTPDIFRSGHNGEHEMLCQQLAAWNKMNVEYGVGGRSQLMIQVPGANGQMRTVQVQPNFIAVNFGVNGWAVNTVKGALGMSWGQVEELNQGGVQRLRLAVTDYVNRTLKPIITNPQLSPAEREAAERKRQAITKLSMQIDAMMEAGSAQTDGDDAYKMVARLNVLAYLIGATPAWNCKSGKDRTGQLDVESKFLATMIELKGPDGIPEPGAELTDEERSIFQKIALEGGNHEMQVHNTGLAGFKTGGVASIKTRLGGDQYKEIHKGAADYVKV